MLKRTKIGGEIHMAQASMLSTSACFLAVRPTSTYCKSFVRKRHLRRHLKYLHSSVTGKRETFRFPGSFGSRRLFCRWVPPFLSSRGSSSSIWPRSSSVPRSSVPARWTSGQCTCKSQAGPSPWFVQDQGYLGTLGAQTWPCREERDAQRRNRLHRLHKREFPLTGCFRRLVCPVVEDSAALLLLLWLNRFFRPSSIVRRGFRLFFSINRITAYSRSAAENCFFNATLLFWTGLLKTKKMQTTR